jgi:gamma-glutamyltranspeptidase/glutathione hydrolase
MTEGGTVNLETGFSPEVLQRLQDMGHVLRIGPGGFGGYQAILRDPKTGTYAGASESRKDGQAAGY